MDATQREARLMRAYASRHHDEHDDTRPQREPFCRWCQQHATENALDVPRYYSSREPGRKAARS